MTQTPTPQLKPRRKVRLLPVVIVGAAALLVVRLGELSLGIDLLPASPALAAEQNKQTPKPENASDATATDAAATAADVPPYMTVS